MFRNGLAACGTRAQDLISAKYESSKFCGYKQKASFIGRLLFRVEGWITPLFSVSQLTGQTLCSPFFSAVLRDMDNTIQWSETRTVGKRKSISCEEHLKGLWPFKRRSRANQVKLSGF